MERIKTAKASVSANRYGSHPSLDHKGYQSGASRSDATSTDLVADSGVWADDFRHQTRFAPLRCASDASQTPPSCFLAHRDAWYQLSCGAHPTRHSLSRHYCSRARSTHCCTVVGWFAQCEPLLLDVNLPIPMNNDLNHLAVLKSVTTVVLELLGSRPAVRKLPGKGFGLGHRNPRLPLTTPAGAHGHCSISGEN